MKHAIAPAFVLALVLGACDGPVVNPGVCCAPAASPCVSSNPRGGWASSEASCAGMTINASDGRFERGTDEHGCAYWIVAGFCSGSEDGSSAVCCGGVLPRDGGG